jgi:hypothetical protein
VLALTASFLLAAASAAHSPLDAIRACAAEKNDSARLACYDRVAGAATPAAAPSVAAAKPAVVAAPAATPPPASAAPTADEFGMTEELRRKRSPAAEKPAAPQELRARVIAVERRQGDTRRIKLDNGQTWDETERKRTLVVSNGDTVTIKPSVMGGYFLMDDAGVAARVKRVQ